MTFRLSVLTASLVCGLAGPVAAQHPLAAPRVTSLTNPNVQYREAAYPFVVLKRGDVEAIVIDNSAFSKPPLPEHRAGYNGVASLRHTERDANLFVPTVAGLNFEHIHDGTTKGLVEKFEPRKADMQLRVINQHTVELYQPPTPHWKLESCGRYELLEDGAIEYTFECVPREATFSQNFIGLFWASYIHQPEDLAIHFVARPRQQPDQAAAWVRSESPSHGVRATHAPPDWPELPPIDADFPLTLVHNPSPYLYSQPWYYGRSGNMALAFLFRPRDRIGRPSALLRTREPLSA